MPHQRCVRLDIIPPEGDMAWFSPDDFSTNPRCDFYVEALLPGEVKETNAWHELGNMSIENANVISAYVALVWAVAWGFRAIRSSISNYESKENE